MKKKKLIIISIISILIIITLVIIILLNQKNRQLKKAGIDFYENFYYEELSKTDGYETILETLNENGLKITLNYLVEYDKKYDEEFEGCNPNKTIVTIYPESPYKKDSYRIETSVDC